MRKRSLLALLTSFSLLIGTGNIYANENVITFDNSTSQESVIITDLELDGCKKIYDEKTDTYIFVPEKDILSVDEEIDSIISITGGELAEKILDDEVTNEKDSALEDEQSDEITTLASLPDLTVSSLTVSPLVAGGDSKIGFVLSNKGNVNANNVEVGFKVDGKSVGSYNYGTIEANTSYTAYVTLSGIPSGSHTIQVIADVNNKITESNESNNSVSGTYTWQYSGSLPDLSVEIISPKNNAVLDGPKSEDDTIPFEIKIKNTGAAMTSGRNFLFAIYVVDKNGQEIPQGGYYAPAIGANGSLTGTANFYFGAYQPTDVMVKVDTNNEVAESNEDNNTDTKTYKPKFCTHDARGNLKRNRTKDLSVRIETSAISKDNQVPNGEIAPGILPLSMYESNLPKWNGIVDNCSIISMKISNRASSEDDIIIKGDSKYVSGTAVDFDAQADTTTSYYDGKMISVMTLNTRTDGIISSYYPLPLRERTLVHEIGHAYALGHPSDSPSCKYLAIMNQTNDEYSSSDITLHDKYNLYDKYNKSTYSINEDKPSEIRTSVDLVNLVEDISEIENKADYIIKAKVLPDSENVVNNFYSGYTKTKLQVTKVYKGSLAENDEISLREPYWTGEGENAGITFYKGSYNPSNVGSEYIFFLSKFDDADIYGLRYLTMGRYPIESQKKGIMLDNSMNESEQSQYRDLHTQVLNKYE